MEVVHHRYKKSMLEEYEAQFKDFICAEMVTDPAHDISHVHRVVKTAKEICSKEGGILEIVLPAAYLHDCFTAPKNHPDRAKSSTKAAEKARDFLSSIDYPSEFISEIEHAIAAHSFSAGIKPVTKEAQIVQDADRLDSLGAIGVSRCLLVSSSFGASLYHFDDPHAASRELDDTAYTLDHFQVKLFKLADQLNTDTAKEMARTRVNFMRTYVEQLNSEM